MTDRKEHGTQKGQRKRQRKPIEWPASKKRKILGGVAAMGQGEKRGFGGVVGSGVGIGCCLGEAHGRGSLTS